MLTRLEVDGLKSFEQLAIDLAPLTVIVGNNAAGKSNPFDAVQLPANLATRDVAETAADVLAPDGANLAAVLARLQAATATETHPYGILTDIAAELNNLIPGISRLDAQLHEASGDKGPRSAPVSGPCSPQRGCLSASWRA